MLWLKNKCPSQGYTLNAWSPAGGLTLGDYGNFRRWVYLGEVGSGAHLWHLHLTTSFWLVLHFWSTRANTSHTTMFCPNMKPIDHGLNTLKTVNKRNLHSLPLSLQVLRHSNEKSNAHIADLVPSLSLFISSLTGHSWWPHVLLPYHRSMLNVALAQEAGISLTGEWCLEANVWAIGVSSVGLQLLWA